MSVIVDDTVKTPKLRVPRALLQSLRADAGQPNHDFAFSTVVAGVALAAALATGGLWLVRSRRKGGGLIMVLGAVGLLLGTGGLLWADAVGPWLDWSPRRRRVPSMSQLVDSLPPGLSLSDGATVEITDKGVEIVLVVNRESLAGVMKQETLDEKLERLKKAGSLNP